MKLFLIVLFLEIYSVNWNKHYNNLGQFKYNFINDNPIITEKVWEDKQHGKYLKIKASFYLNFSEWSRWIEVYKEGVIKEYEQNEDMNVVRSRIICADGKWTICHALHSNEIIDFDHYFDSDLFNWGSHMTAMRFVRYPDGKEIWGRVYEGWNGVRNYTYPNGKKKIGYWHNDEPIGKHEFSKLDGTTRVLDFGYKKFC